MMFPEHHGRLIRRTEEDVAVFRLVISSSHSIHIFTVYETEQDGFRRTVSGN